MKLCALLFGEMEVKEGGYSSDGLEEARNVVVGEERANLAAIFMRSLIFVCPSLENHIYVTGFGYGCGYSGDRLTLSTPHMTNVTDPFFFF